MNANINYILIDKTGSDPKCSSAGEGINCYEFRKGYWSTIERI